MTDWLHFNSHDEDYKKPFGAVACGKSVELKLAVTGEKHIEEVKLVIWGAAFGKEDFRLELHQVEEARKYYGLSFTVPAQPGLLWYYFQVQADGETYYYGNNEQRQGGIGQSQVQPPLPYQITVYREEGQRLPGSWFTEGVVYHIFVDRFYNGSDDGKVLNPKAGSLIHGRWEDTPVYLRDREGRIVRWDFFGGNLLGIIKKLLYLRELGVSILYLSPIFTAPSNHKYDTADYLQVDPMFGTEADFQQLCQLAREQGIYIMLDGVFSHTGSDSIYFNKYGTYPGQGAYQSPDSPYYSWYRFQEYPHKYQSWWGIDSLPNVNELEPTYLAFILRDQDSVIRHWMKAGVRGWRLDVADELPDAFIRELHNTVKEMDPQAVVIGEVWEDASNKLSYEEQRQFFLGEHLDGVTNYPFRRILLDFILGRSNPGETHLALMSLAENYPHHNLHASLNILGSHDVPRALTLLGEGPKGDSLSEPERERYRLGPEQRELAKKRLKLLALFQLTFPGVPCIYYGDEVGSEGYADPFNRGSFPWGREDQELLEWYKKIIKLRQNHDVLRLGEWFSLGLELDQDNPGCGVYGYIRRLDGQVVVVLLNPNKEKARTVKMRQESTGCTKLSEVWTNLVEIGSNGFYTVTLAPLQGRIFMGVSVEIE